MTALAPIANGLWTDGPRLIGGRGTDGKIRFPMPDGDDASDFTAVPLSSDGTLWSWTIQSFEPKRPPYDGPVPFEPFMLGYVELANEIIVEARIVEVAEPRIGMPLTLRIVPFDVTRSTFAFGPKT
jgi:uncharacterized OB-fold protein